MSKTFKLTGQDVEKMSGMACRFGAFHGWMFNNTCLLKEILDEMIDEQVEIGEELLHADRNSALEKIMVSVPKEMRGEFLDKVLDKALGSDEMEFCQTKILKFQHKGILWDKIEEIDAKIQELVSPDLDKVMEMASKDLRSHVGDELVDNLEKSIKQITDKLNELGNGKLN